MGTEVLICEGDYWDCMGCHEENHCCERCLACQEIEEEELDGFVQEELDEGDPESCMEGGWNASEHCMRCPSAEFCREIYRKMIKEAKKEEPINIDLVEWEKQDIEERDREIAEGRQGTEALK